MVGSGGAGAGGGGNGANGLSHEGATVTECGGTGGNPGGSDSQSSGGGGGGGYNGGGGGGGDGNCALNDACVYSGVNNEITTSGFGGGGGGGGGSDFHSSAVTNYAELIDAPGPSATITYVVAGAVQAITTSSVGVGGAPVEGLVIGLLGIATFLSGAVAAGRRRAPSDSSPRA